MQVHVVDATNANQYSQELAAMFRQRYDVFVKRKGWQLPGADPVSEEERDEYDANPAAVYLMVIGADGEYIGSTRMLPSVTAHLSSGPLASFWQVPAPAPHSGCWEISRTVTATHGSWEDIAAQLSVLMAGVIEWAVQSGIETIFGVGDQRYVAAMTETGWRLKLHGLPTAYPEGGRGVPVSWPIDQATLEVTRERRGVSGSVLFQPPRIQVAV